MKSNNVENKNCESQISNVKIKRDNNLSIDSVAHDVELRLTLNDEHQANGLHQTNGVTESTKILSDTSTVETDKQVVTSSQKNQPGKKLRTMLKLCDEQNHSKTQTRLLGHFYFT